MRLERAARRTCAHGCATVVRGRSGGRASSPGTAACAGRLRLEAMREVDAAWRGPDAQSDAMRAAARTCSAVAMLRLARRLAVGPSPAADRRRLVAGPSCWARPPPRPGCPRSSWPGWSAYDDVQTVLAAALKLLPLDPADATALVRGAAAGEVERLVERGPA